MTIDINTISTTFAEMDNDKSLMTTFSIEEKLLATEQILFSYREIKAKIPEIRQALFDEKIRDAKYSNHKDFSDAVEQMNEEINTVNSYDEEDIYLLEMTRKSSAQLTTLLLEMEKLSQQQDILLAEIKRDQPLKVRSIAGVELEKITDEMLLKLKEIHVSRNIILFFQKGLVQ